MTDPHPFPLTLETAMTDRTAATETPPPGKLYAQHGCHCVACVAIRRTDGERVRAPAPEPAAPPAMCGCPDGDLKARLEAAFPGHSVRVTETIAVDLRADRAAAPLFDALRAVRRLLTAPYADLGLGPDGPDDLAAAVRLQVEDGLNDALPGLLKAAGALAALGRVRMLDGLGAATPAPG